MPRTAEWMPEIYPVLGEAAPYDPRWSIRASVLYTHWLNQRVNAANNCERWAMVLSAEPNQHQAEYDYYPGEWFEPYQARRRAVGFELFEQLGIARADREAREKQTLRNFEFFDAPVALFISLDRRLSLGSYVDLGMFIQNLLLVAREHDLHTCAQAAFAPFHRIVRHHIPLADEHLLVCAVSLGYEDPDALENMLQTPREVVSGFSEFHGF